MKVILFVIVFVLFFVIMVNVSIEFSLYVGQWDKIFWFQVKVDYILLYGLLKGDDFFFYDV